MSTTGIDSWAVDLADIGAVYPFQGTEVVMTIIGVVLWIAWHVWQIKFENKTFEEDEAKLRQQHSMEETIKRQNSLN
ncbi:MAG TPA: hypothetical protein VKN76_05975 [Kiloniellaceae bacterium]|nr:hypothetical protein [Kiloniellaceae bacterium]